MATPQRVNAWFFTCKKTLKNKGFLISTKCINLQVKRRLKMMKFCKKGTVLVTRFDRVVPLCGVDIVVMLLIHPICVLESNGDVSFGIEDFNMPKHYVATDTSKELILTAKKGDKVVAFKDESPIDTILGVEIFPVVHMKTKEEIYVSLEDIK